MLQPIERSISSIIHVLVEQGLADQFNIPSVRSQNKHSGDIGFASEVDLSWAMKDQPYSRLYQELVDRRQFHVMLPDGGMLQFLYRIRLGKVCKHRLAYYPSYSLKPFDADSLRYLQDSVWGHVVSEFQMPVVIRLDFEDSARSFVPISHSASHMTLGQYPNCRIPVSAPFTPWAFTELILRNFYSRAFGPVFRSNVFRDFVFEECLTSEEASCIHLRLPS